MKNLKKRLNAGETLIGCWSSLGSPMTSEIIGLSGFDWVLIDLEHGAGVEKDALSQMQALEHTPAASIIRVESSQEKRISRVLDMGAEGVMCPRVNSAREAESVAKALRYPPEGNRGVAKMVRATRFGQNFKDYYDNVKENLLGIVQIETMESLKNLDAIASVEGVDVLFIGPSDLSMELGIFGQFDAPVFVKALQNITSAAEKAGKATGILLSDPSDLPKYHDMGIRLIACGSDAGFVAKGARETARKLHSERSAINKNRK